ncbi:MAG: hypothetical protein ACI9S9_003474, partial [Planctomycetota bacterium]
ARQLLSCRTGSTENDERVARCQVLHQLTLRPSSTLDAVSS